MSLSWIIIDATLGAPASGADRNPPRADVLSRSGNSAFLTLLAIVRHSSANPLSSAERALVDVITPSS
jgi:hypothetical protein